MTREENINKWIYELPGVSQMGHISTIVHEKSLDVHLFVSHKYNTLEASLMSKYVFKKHVTVSIEVSYIEKYICSIKWLKCDNNSTNEQINLSAKTIILICLMLHIFCNLERCSYGKSFKSSGPHCAEIREWEVLKNGQEWVNFAKYFLKLVVDTKSYKSKLWPLHGASSIHCKIFKLCFTYRRQGAKNKFCFSHAVNFFNRRTTNVYHFRLALAIRNI